MHNVSSWTTPLWKKQATQINSTDKEAQLTGGKLVGYASAQPKSWTRDYLEQIQLMMWTKLEFWINRFQVQRPSHSPTYFPNFVPLPTFKLVKFRKKSRLEIKGKPDLSTLHHSQSIRSGRAHMCTQIRLLAAANQCSLLQENKAENSLRTHQGPLHKTSLCNHSDTDRKGFGISVYC